MSLMSVLCFSRYAGKPSSLEVIVTIETTLSERLRKISSMKTGFSFLFAAPLRRKPSKRNATWNVDDSVAYSTIRHTKRMILFSIYKISTERMSKHCTSKNAHHRLKISLFFPLTPALTFHLQKLTVNFTLNKIIKKFISPFRLSALDRFLLSVVAVFFFICFCFVFSSLLLA